MGVKKTRSILSQGTEIYKNLKKVNGRHPIQKLSDQIYVNYQARLRKGGNVFYFNFDLAKEMGLISKDHPNKLNKDLEQILLDTFGLVIINEYDIENYLKFPEKEIKDHQYMATRYLQLQHPDNIGKNSGDGRSIWNGSIKGKHHYWDISSRGTGATRLSPATSKYSKFFQSGDPTISYGCGYAEIDEAIGSLFFSEVFNRNGIKTERILAIIDYGNGICINVRAYPNLLRPSHFFVHLKQNNLETLTQLLDYHIEREVKNKSFTQEVNNKNKYKLVLDKFIDDFAYMAAKFEDEYIFCWMDWDGDNILMDGGIIDYGSIRQFGLFHHEYRYDDVERFSTSIKEQKSKVQHMVMTFAQVVDYVETGKKKPLSKYKNHSSSKKFEEQFQYYKNINFLEKLGYSKDQVLAMIDKDKKKVEKFRNAFSYFERAKSVEGLYQVPDGINWNAIFCMRDLLRVLPQLYLVRNKHIDAEEFIEIMASTYATEKDIELTTYRKKKVKDFQKFYWKFLDKVSELESKDFEAVLLEVNMRSSIRNRYDRITGDSIAYIVHGILKDLKKYKKDIYDIVNDFVNYQAVDVLIKDNKKTKFKHESLMRKFFDIVVECREGI